MKKIYLYIIFLLVFHALILSQLRFTAWPEMVSFPYLINHGFVTYRDMVHAYPPLLVNILAILYKVFGYKLLVLKIFGWVTILISDLLIFFILKKMLSKEKYVVTGVLTYIILQPVLEGNMVWPDLFIVPLLLLTFLFLTEKKYLFAGLSIGLAFLTKQTAILYIGGSILYIVVTEKKLKRLFSFLSGGLIIGIPFLASLISQNSLKDFINWTIIFPSEYWTKFPGYVQLSPTLRENLILLVLFLPFAFLVFKVNKRFLSQKSFLLLFSFLICGIVGVYPRFSFFHLQGALAFLIIITIYLTGETKMKLKYLSIPVLLVLLFSYHQIVFGGNRFWDKSDLELAQIIQNETPAGKPIYLLGLDSNIYAYSDRLPNSPWLDNFGWYLEIPGVQKSVVKGFKTDEPSIIFWQTPENGNWYDIGTYEPHLITSWIEKNYSKTKEIEKGIWEWKLN